TGLEELRVKESDRLAVMAAAMRATGARIEEQADGLIVEGTGGEPLQGRDEPAGTHLDHRTATSTAVAGHATRPGGRIDDTTPIATSFPQFELLLESATSTPA